MTFRQLVDKYRFEEIISELTEFWDKGNLYLFRQALDILRTLEPKKNDERDCIRVSMVTNEIESYNRVSNLSEWAWNENLNWEIVVDDECNLSEKQLLALCLWERTFYGFSPEQQSDTFNKWDEELECDKPEPDEMDKRRKLINDICSKYPGLSHNDMDFILTDRELRYHTFAGISEYQGGEIDYIKESISSYSDLPAVTSNKPCIALLRIPTAYSVSDISIRNLQNSINDVTGCSSLKFHTRFSSEGDSLTLTLLYI